MEKRERVRIFAPSPIEDPLPSFPEGFEGDVDAHICAEIVVAAEGNVAHVTQIDSYPSCEPVSSNVSMVLFPAVASKLREWQFFSGGTCEYYLNESECESPEAKINRIAMKLAYSINFVRANGVEEVSRTRE